MESLLQTGRLPLSGLFWKKLGLHLVLSKFRPVSNKPFLRENQVYYIWKWCHMKIMNMSLRDGIFASNWKTAFARPLLKKLGLQLVLSNSRPVSNLLFLRKKKTEKIKTRTWDKKQISQPHVIKPLTQILLLTVITNM